MHRTMATLHPFRAVRPSPELASQIACVPYDVINTKEATVLAEGNPRSFLRIIRPEIDLPEAVDEYDDQVYAKGAQNLRNYIDGPDSIQEVYPALYVYRLIMNRRPQTGVFGCVSVADYDDDTILKHEKTRPKKEDDRTRHIMQQHAHAEPVMLTFKDHEGVADVIQKTAETEPLYDFTAPDGVRHTIWIVQNTNRLVDYFRDIDRLYVADGHHRCKAASRTAENLAGKEGVSSEVSYFPAVLFPMGDVHIMAYNRIIRQLPSSPSGFLATLKSMFASHPSDSAMPGRKGVMAVYMDGQWTTFQLPEHETDNVVDSLDVGILSDRILAPLLNITDPRTDGNIDFVGGIRGTEELERLVDSGQAEMAISMYPTSIDELVAVSDAGLLMPPKSTWFEPKLRSGLLVHIF